MSRELSPAGVEDCNADLGCLCALLRDVIRAHEHKDDDPVNLTSLYGLLSAAERTHRELHAAIDERRW